MIGIVTSRSPPFFGWATALALTLLLSLSAAANDFDIYRSDYPKGAFCSAIAGACSSDNDPENSFFQNPASLTSGDAKSLNLIFDADYDPSDNLEPGMKSDNKVNNTVYMGGAGVVGKSWGLAAAFSARQTQVVSIATVSDDQDNSKNFRSTDNALTVQLNVPFGLRVSKTFSLGLALSSIYYTEHLNIEGADTATTKNIDKIPPLGFTVGYLWQPSRYFRIGGWARTSTTFYINQQITFNQISTSVALNEDIGLHSPWIVADGLSIMPFGDKATLLFDVDAIGTTPNGYQRTLDTFAGSTNGKALRSKGSTRVLEPHLGWRSPFTQHSRLTYYLGSYYENSRWEGLPGRAHVVAGVSVDIGITEALLAVEAAKDFFSFQFSFR